MPVTIPRRPSLSIASETAQESSRFKRVTRSFILLLYPGRPPLKQAPGLFPIQKCHSVSGTGVGAIARNVVDFVETLPFSNHRGDYRQPVLDFGCSDPEIVFGQSRQGILITALHRAQNSLIEFLVDYEMRQASGSYERHSLVAIPILDR